MEASDTPQAPTPQAYHVEVEDEGCSMCGHDRLWVIVDPEGIAGGTSYYVEGEAQDIAELLNAAYNAGQKAVSNG